MALDDPYGRQPHASPFVSRIIVQPLERGKELVGVFHVEPDPVIRYEERT